MDTSKPPSNRVTHRTKVLLHLCRILVSVIPEQIWVHIDLLVLSVKIFLSLGTCPHLHHLNQLDKNIPKDKPNSRLPGASCLKHRSNANMTSNFRQFETKVLRWIRCVEEMIEVAALILGVFWRNLILDEVESS